MSEVWITGIGLIGPAGLGIESVVQAGRARMPALVPWPQEYSPPHDGATLGLAGPLPGERFFTERQLRMMDRTMVMSASAVGLALEDAGLPQAAAALDDAGTFFSTARGEQPSTLRFMQPIVQAKQLNPAHFPLIARNISVGQIAIRFGMRGPSTMLASGPLGALESIGRAAHFVRSGRARLAVAGGFEVLSKYQLSFLKELYGGWHVGGPAFFGAGPGYIAPSEGACVLVLESGAHARLRSASPIAKIDAFESGRLGRSGAERALSDAVERVMLKTNHGSAEIGCVLPSSAGSNRPHEVAETALLEMLVRKHGAPICAVRSITGEGETFTSALQVAVGALGVQTGSLPPTLHVCDSAPENVRTWARAERLTAGSALVSGVDESGSYAMLQLSAV